MSLAYFDSSALVKLVVEEAGSEDVATLWDGADALLSSRVAHPEVRAALAAARRDDRLDDGGFADAKAAWEEFRTALTAVELTPELEIQAGELAERHALSGFDAIHLASAVALAEGPVIVATWDGRLLAAARESGLATLPAEL